MLPISATYNIKAHPPRFWNEKKRPLIIQLISLLKSDLVVNMVVKKQKKESDVIRNSLIIREPMTRFELVTSSLPRKRSTPELHRLFDAANLILFYKLSTLSLG